MRLARMLFRLVVLLVVGALFVELTAMYGRSAHPFMPNARGQWEIQHQPPTPSVGYVTDFLGQTILLAIFAWLGRMLLRLRLNPAPRNEGKPILLGLHRTQREELKPLVAPPAC